MLSLAELEKKLYNLGAWACKLDWYHEPHHEKTNNVVSEQVRHKPSCTSTQKMARGNFRYRLVV